MTSSGLTDDAAAVRRKSRWKWLIALVILAIMLLLGGCMVWWNLDRFKPIARRVGAWPKSTVQQRTPDRLRVLFVGNSFTHYNGGQALILQQMARSAGKMPEPVFDQITVAGATWMDLWDASKARDTIGQGSWDYVVLQDYSAAAIQWRKGMGHYGKLFSDLIRSVNARPIFFMTWARSDEPMTQKIITAAYTEVAAENNAVLSPVGLAWQTARRFRPSLQLHLSSDHKHPTPAGSYLTACVFYSVLFNQSPHGLQHKFEDQGNTFIDISDDDATFLQDIAWKTVQAAGPNAIATPDGTAPATQPTTTTTQP